MVFHWLPCNFYNKKKLYKMLKYFFSILFLKKVLIIVP